MNSSTKKRKIAHNWNRSTLGECARTHMDQITDAYFNYGNGPNKELTIKRVIESYFKIYISVMNNKNFITVDTEQEEKSERAEHVETDSEKHTITTITSLVKNETKQAVKLIKKFRPTVKRIKKFRPAVLLK